MKEYIKPTADLIVFDVKTLITADMPSGEWGDGEELE